MRGHVVQLHLKPREGRAPGIPKRPVTQLTITPEGVEGDFNRWRTEKLKGDPDQAVCRVVQGGTVRAGAPVEVRR